MSGFKKILVIALTVSLGLANNSAQAENFTESQKGQILEIVEDFKSAMGSVSLDPAANCPGLTANLRQKLSSSESLFTEASLLATEELDNSYFGKAILDTELAFQFIEKACSSEQV